MQLTFEVMLRERIPEVRTRSLKKFIIRVGKVLYQLSLSTTLHEDTPARPLDLSLGAERWGLCKAEPNLRILLEGRHLGCWPQWPETWSPSLAVGRHLAGPRALGGREGRPGGHARRGLLPGQDVSNWDFNPHRAFS